VAGHAVAHPQEDPLRLPHLPGEAEDGLFGHAGEGARPLWGPLFRFLLELLQAHRRLPQVLPVQKALPEEDVGQGVGQGGVGAGAELEVEVGEAGGEVFVGVYVV